MPGLTARPGPASGGPLRAGPGQLAADVLDLTEGAAELVAFGAADAQVAAIRAHDRELTGISAASAGTAGIGLALTTLLAGLASGGACWSASRR